MKLGLLAMSGVRAHDPELTALGLTLPGFVERNKVIASLPSLGLLTLAGLTPKSIDVEYVEVPDVLPEPWLPGEFDAVAISSFTAQIGEAYALADRYRRAGTKVLLGGLHATALPDEAGAHADAVSLGDGEPSWPRMMQDLLRGDLQPVYDARQQAYNLAKSPLPRYDLLDVDRYNRLTVQTSRGCPFNCEFCAASIRLHPSYRLKPIDLVVRDIRAIKDAWPRPFVEFADDNTCAAKGHARALMKAIEKEDIRWFTETDVSLADDLDLVRMMRDSGCAQVLIGLEAPTRDLLEQVETRANWKARRCDRYLEAIHRIQSCGITVNGCFVLGLDGAGPDSFEDVRRFIEQSGLYEVQITVQTAFPGTPLYRRLLNENRILRENAWELCTLFDVNFRPARMTVEELEQGLRHLAATLYDSDVTAERRRRYRQQLRHARRAVASSEQPR